MPKLSFMDSLLRRGKRSIPSDILKSGPVLNLKEGEEAVLIYTSASDKMKVFSNWIKEGLENGDRVFYSYPDEEDDLVRCALVECGIKVEKFERTSALNLHTQSDFFLPDGKFDKDRLVRESLDVWAKAAQNGYKHTRGIEDVGNLSFLNGNWELYLEYWDHPGWEDPRWALPGQLGVVYKPFIMDITAVNVEDMTKTQLTELLKAFGRGTIAPARFIDLIGDVNSFSEAIGLDHEQLFGHKILLEFDPVSDYEKVVDRLAKESRANVEPLFVFTSTTSPLYKYLANQPAIKFFLTSISTSTPKLTSENTVLLPAKNAPLILDAISKVLETYADANVCFVFDIVSELLASIGPEKTFIFLRHAFDMLSSEKTTSLFLLNTGAHQTEVVSQLRNLFSNQLAYDKNGLEIVKTS
jgi:hypothetical protein